VQLRICLVMAWVTNTARRLPFVQLFIWVDLLSLLRRERRVLCCGPRFAAVLVHVLLAVCWERPSQDCGRSAWAVNYMQLFVTMTTSAVALGVVSKCSLLVPRRLTRYGLDLISGSLRGFARGHMKSFKWPCICVTLLFFGCVRWGLGI